MESPYAGLGEKGWKKKTGELVRRHPLEPAYIRKTVTKCWDCILGARIGGYSVGHDIFPKPQIMGALLHELICLEISKSDPDTWSCEKDQSDKDIVNLKNPYFSIEVKTSSHKSHIFGNRSFAQHGEETKKEKSGYYLAVNFEKFADNRPRITKIRFGWLDHDDWIGQKSETGQQSHLSSKVEENKLLEI